VLLLNAPTFCGWYLNKQHYIVRKHVIGAILELGSFVSSASPPVDCILYGAIKIRVLHNTVSPDVAQCAYLSGQQSTTDGDVAATSDAMLRRTANNNCFWEEQSIVHVVPN